jgi:FtsP/CotA-like multicopper oxidase with cupredoxin domain
LQPGYREDTLVVYPHAGSYCVIDTGIGANASISHQPENRALLGMVKVTGTATIADQKSYLLGKLVGAARAAYADKKVAERVAKELQDPSGILLTSFVQHADLRNAAVNPKTQELSFVFTGDYPEIGTKLDGSNAVAYNGEVARWLHLGTTDEWKMTATTDSGGHPYHIHVNPFQIVAIYKGLKEDPANDVSVTGEKDDMQYANLKGQWKDTIFVKEGYLVVMRTHYAEFTGGFVLHCHILYHEDKGMMEKIVITKDGKPDPKYDMGMMEE